MTPEPAAPPRRGGLKRLVRFGFLALVTVFLALAIVDQRERIGDDFRSLEPLPVLLSGVLGFLGMLVGMLAWRELLAGLGSRLPLRTAGRIFLVGQLGKYIPGSVWPVLAQMDMGSDAGVPKRRMGTASVLGIAMSLVAAIAVGALAVPALLTGDEGGGSYALLLLLIPIAVVALHPRVLNPVLDRGLRLLGRQPLEHRLTGPVLLRAALVSVLAWLLLGLHAYVLAKDLGAEGADALALSIGGYALASAAGLLFVIAPAGAGVREVVIVLVLSPEIGEASALVLALVSRLLVTAADVVLAAGGALAVRRRTPHV